MCNIIENVNSFCFKFLDYDDEIMNYSINENVKDCLYLENTNKLVFLAKKLNLNEIGSIYNKRVQLLYKGSNLKNCLTKYTDKFSNKIIKECYFENFEDEYDNLYSQKKKLINKLKSYNELGFVHETSINNIENIYKSGYIYSRNEVRKENIIKDDIAENEVLRRTNPEFFNMARFYLRTKTPAHYKFNTQQHSTCIFVCDYNVVFEKNNIYMTNEIATKAFMMNDLNNILNINWLYENLNYKRIYEENYVEGYAKDYKGAEFLIKDKLPIKYLKAIIFKSKSEAEEFIRKYPKWNIDVICDIKQFKDWGY